MRSPNDGISFRMPKSVVIIVISMIIIGYMIIVYSVIFPKNNNNSNINSALQTINELTSKVSELEQQVETNSNKNANNDNSINLNTDSTIESNSYRPGLIILGMHRSGTSIIGGLINKMGLNAGGPLIRPASDNEKGFFERIDVVLQNDIIMRKQHVDYSASTYRYDSKLGLKNVLAGDLVFKEGERGLKFLNDPGNYPWMLKDPRLCITLRTWLPLLNFIPAVLYTYRHPMDVARSLNTRYEKFPYGRSLRMWYIYNKRAIRQSHDLCRVTTSHQRIMTQPEIELEHLYYQLIKCGIPVPRKLTKTEIAEFVDPKLQHGKSALKDESCDKDLNSLQIPSIWETNDANHLKLYREVMRVYCAMEDGSVFKHDFEWDDDIQDR